NEQMDVAGRIREIISVSKEAEELLSLGAYRKGNNPRLDFALEKSELINAFIRQTIDGYSSFEETTERLLSMPLTEDYE
ncbi:MAG TPA: EscN/YscN/HrcN family type III secretion system ATPase, partial [Synergistales bacterium]|nr:EscN/YscN/HrcN family type III secretion system ATPase [Synergistales bacterium]